jgi:ABC-type uncharacterized transport system fused permease/ATPase subunit
MALVASGAWAMALVLAMALVAMVVMAVATSILLSMADTRPLNFIQKIDHHFRTQIVFLIFYYLIIF